MKKILAIVLFLIASQGFAAPFVVSDPLTAGVQCGVYLDGVPKVTIPVTPMPTPAIGNFCKFDIAGVGAGSHTITMTAITVNDPFFGSQESAKSIPLVFVVPSAPIPPVGLRLQP